MSRVSGESVTSKQKILLGAATLYTTKGYDKTRMADLARETGLNKGSLYWHFKNKDDILLSAMEHYLDKDP